MTSFLPLLPLLKPYLQIQSHSGKGWVLSRRIWGDTVHPMTASLIQILKVDYPITALETHILKKMPTLVGRPCCHLSDPRTFFLAHLFTCRGPTVPQCAPRGGCARPGLVRSSMLLQRIPPAHADEFSVGPRASGLGLGWIDEWGVDIKLGVYFRTHSVEYKWNDREKKE